MLWKLAFLFLIAMGALVMFKARPKGNERPVAPPRRRSRFRRRAKKAAAKSATAETAETAEKCPRCGAWAPPGARCDCGDG